MRILVIGAGGIGGTIAGRLALANEDVTICVRTPPKDNCLLLDEGGKVRRVSVPVVTTWQGSEYDVVILAVRPNQLSHVLKDVAPSETTYVVCQNGLCEGVVQRLVGQQALVIGAVVSWGASRIEGVIYQTAKGYTSLGVYGNRGFEVAAQLSELLSKVHPVSMTDNLLGVRWSKLALNAAASALCVLLGSSLGRAFLRPRAIQLGVRLIEEVCDVASAHGIRMEPIADTVDLQKLFYPPDRSRFAKFNSVVLLTMVALRYFRLESSMWRAIKSGEASGIEWICGAVVDQAQPKSRAAMNEAVVDTIVAIEQGSQEHGSAAIARVFELAEMNRATE